MHQRLERRLLPAFETLDAHGYVRVLQAYHGFLLPWQEHLHRTIDAADRAFFADRRYADRLAQDLAASHALPDTQRANVDRLFSDTASAIGSAYVIEGSMLGGRVVLRLLRDRLDLDESRTHYFAGHGRETAAAWKKFRDFAESRVDMSDDVAADRASVAAQATFSAMHEWFVEREIIA